MITKLSSYLVGSKRSDAVTSFYRLDLCFLLDCDCFAYFYLDGSLFFTGFGVIFFHQLSFKNYSHRQPQDGLAFTSNSPLTEQTDNSTF